MTASPALKTASGESTAMSPKRRGKRTLIMMALPLALLAAGSAYWVMGGRYESTENANLHQAKVQIAADLSGRVTKALIKDNMLVRAGDILFQVDPEPYRLALAQAEVAVQSARLSVEQLKVSFAQAQAQAALATNDAEYQVAELARQRALSAKGVAATSALDDAEHLANRSTEQRDVALQAAEAVRAALGGDPAIATDDHPTVQAAIVARDRAKYNLSLTSVAAPADGVIYQAASFRTGQMVTAGQSLFALVETGDAWVEANFKETQLDGISPGQSTEVEFDAVPGRKFPATVEAIGAGTGAEFSLLPAQNATGNWVKVTQRVPVRIKLEDMTSIAALASGMSAKVTVDTGRSHSISMLFASAEK